MARPRTPKGRTREVARRLADVLPAECELQYGDPFQLLVATILSAQSTDAGVNQVTPALFARYPAASDLARAAPGDVQDIIRPTGFFQAKSKSLIGMATRVEEAYGGQVPGAMEDLVTLPGVGRKTANVVRSVGLGLPGLPVDTHVLRVTKRLGLVDSDDPAKVETVLSAALPAAERGDFSLRVILFGRRVCLARTPRCGSCVLEDMCPSSRLPRKVT